MGVGNPVSLFLPLAFSLGLGLGFALGVFCYAHVYGHFLVRAEQAYQAKLMRVTQQAALGKKALEERLERIRNVYGSALGKREQTDVDEAVQESILGSGPGDREA